MFDPQFDEDEADKATRRRFLALSAAGLAGVVLTAIRKPATAAAADAKESAQQVTIIEFSNSGQRLKKVHENKIVRSEAEWRKQLSPNAFDITRHADTEMAFTGQYWNLHEKGLYRCICCGNALFTSGTKFDSGTGWPSFWAPIAEENVRKASDNSLGMMRTAVSCTLCDAHLGHVFDDGPPPTGLRYCMNSASLRFVGKKTS
ncbi:MAG TPA: peptide-methionine (R)-S-oxide reductase MsrB [Terriglobales bacterium]|nr:peptide-methionine (R)-S-oxide reductase MsrB [Terriglobales bacterium]